MFCFDVRPIWNKRPRNWSPFEHERERKRMRITWELVSVFLGKCLSHRHAFVRLLKPNVKTTQLSHAVTRPKKNLRRVPQRAVIVFWIAFSCSFYCIERIPLTQSQRRLAKVGYSPMYHRTKNSCTCYLNLYIPYQRYWAYIYIYYIHTHIHTYTRVCA